MPSAEGAINAHQFEKVAIMVAEFFKFLDLRCIHEIAYEQPMPAQHALRRVVQPREGVSHFGLRR